MFRTTFSLLIGLFIPAICAAQLQDFRQTGWKQGPSATTRLLLNEQETNTVSFKRFTSENQEGVFTIVNKLSFKSADSGAIEVAFRVLQHIANDTSEVRLLVNGYRSEGGLQTFMNPTIASLIGVGVKEEVKLTIPFDQTIDSLLVGIWLKGPSSVDIGDFNLTISEGEFSDEWKRNYSHRIQNDPELQRDLFLLAKVWGFLKYFSPEVSQKNVDWDRVMLERIDSIFQNRNELAFQHAIKSMLEIAYPESDTKKTATKVLDSADQQQKINIDHSWIANSTRLDAQTKDKLLQLANYFEPFDNKYVKR